MQAMACCWLIFQLAPPMLWIRSCELNLSVLLMQVTCTVSVTEVILTSVLKAETISYDRGLRRYRSVMSRLPVPPLSLYVHFPWCVRKCPYCDFNSHTLHGALPETDYVDALLSDLAVQAHAAQGRQLQSIFLGGGTPSLFAPEALARLLIGVRQWLGFAADLEVTLEANPGTIERGRFADYRSAGITRVSLGAQSFEPEQLERLGRIHTAADTRRAVDELQAAGLTNFNLDLMYGLPYQTIAQALADIEHAMALQPAHLSHYQLTLEPGTVFAGRPPAGMPDTDHSADMQLACQQRLAEAQYAQYEVSAYASAGARCR